MFLYDLCRRVQPGFLTCFPQQMLFFRKADIHNLLRYLLMNAVA